MYIIDELESNNVPTIPLAIGSLSQSTSLKQWHWPLAHCSSSTIQEIAKGNLVNGLKVSGNTLWGKCEDCILRHQTRQPFDGESEKVLDPLELVSFDLWGPSHVQSVGGK